jgi:hypothetical protein
MVDDASFVGMDSTDITNKIISLSEQRRKRKPLSLDDAAKNAYQKFCNPEFLATIGEEPIGLASGQTNAEGGFIRDDEDDLLADADRDAQDDE